MMKITIKLTTTQEKFLKEFASKHYLGSKDNLGTATPIHVVEVEDNIYFESDSDYADNLVYTYEDMDYEPVDDIRELVKMHYEDLEEECPIEILSLHEIETLSYRENGVTGVDGKKHIIYDVDDYARCYGVPGINSIAVVKRWRPVAFFFILDEAKEYIRYQGHNLRNPRTYTYDLGYSNCGDMPHFRELLFTLGEGLLKKDTKENTLKSKFMEVIRKWKKQN